MQPLLQEQTLAGTARPRHHCMSHSVLQGHYLPQIGHRDPYRFLLRVASGCMWQGTEGYVGCCIKAGNMGVRSKVLKHTTLQLFRRTALLAAQMRLTLLLALRSGGILSDQPLISSVSTAQASMQRSKMIFGFLQRTADNLVRLKYSLLSHRNHLCLA